MCLTPLTACCRYGDTDTTSLGHWIFPDRTNVQSRISSVNSISGTRGPSSVILHHTNNSMSPTGVYTCEIPDVNETLEELNVYSYVGQLPGKSIFFVDEFPIIISKSIPIMRNLTNL